MSAYARLLLAALSALSIGIGGLAMGSPASGHVLNGATAPRTGLQGSVGSIQSVENLALEKARAIKRPVEVATHRTPTQRVLANPSGTLTRELQLSPISLRRDSRAGGLPWTTPAWIRDWTKVASGKPNQSYWHGANDDTQPEYVGKTGQSGDGSGVWRTFYSWKELRGIHGKRIINATFRVQETYASSCAAKPVELWWTGPVNAQTTWANQPAWHRMLAKADWAKGYSSNCPAGDIELGGDGVRDIMQHVADGRWTDLNVGMKATNEAALLEGWKKLGNAPVITVEYNSVPKQPQTGDMKITNPAKGCTEPDGGPVIINTRTPTLAVKVEDDDGSVYADFGMYAKSHGGWVWGRSTSVSSPGWREERVDDGKLTDGETYLWHARAGDGMDTSSLSGWCSFTVDTTDPETPTVGSDLYPDNRQSGGIGRTGTFRFGPGSRDGRADTDVVSFLYDFGTAENPADPPRTELPVDSAGGATVSFTPMEQRPHQLFVRARDRAGNLSEIRKYTILATGTAAGPVAHWKLDDQSGTVAADSGSSGTAVRRGGAATWISAEGTGGALSLNGTDAAYATTAKPVLRTGESFTVSALVRLNQAPDRHLTVLSQDGGALSGFYLQYLPHERRWGFAMPHADSVSGGMSRALSMTLQEHPTGRWTRLTAVHDADSRQLRLYVDDQSPGAAGHQAAWQASGGLQIGRAKWQGEPVDHWPGDVDDVRVYQGVVAPQQLDTAALRGRWKFDGDTESEHAMDSAATPNPGALADGAQPGVDDGRVARALRLNGTDAGHVTTGRSAVRTDESFTVASWVRLDRQPSGDGNFIPVGGQDGARSTGFYLQYVPAWRRWAFGMPRVDDHAPAVDLAVSPVLPDHPVGRWTHLTGVYDSASREMSLFVDGAPAGTVSHHSTWQAGGGVRLGQAKWNHGFTDPWPGLIDDVRIYDRVVPPGDVNNLTRDEIADLANRPTMLDGQWELDDGEGGQAADSSARGNPGALGTGASWQTVADRMGVRLDGTVDGHVMTNAKVRTDASFSVAAWVWMETAPTSGAVAVVTQNGRSQSGFSLRYLKDSRRWSFTIAQTDSVNPLLDQAVSQPLPEHPVRSWIHLAGVYDAAAGRLRLYVNGAPAGTAGRTGAWHADAPDGGVQIGRGRNGGFVDFWPGLLSDVRVYTGTLTDGEVAALAGPGARASRP